MSDKDDYKSLWLSKIIDFNKIKNTSPNYQTYIDNDNEMFSDVETRFRQALEASDLSEEEAKKIMLLLLNDRSYDRCKEMYRAIIRSHKELLNVEIQIRKSDLESKARFLIFRLLTAIGIAAVILGTGVIAYELQIPLPLLRISP